MEQAIRPCHILLVDDHDDTRTVIARLLQLAGHTVETASDCDAAIRLAQRRRFDVLLADIGLPDGNGLQLLSRIREFYPICGVVLSAYGMADDIRKSMEAGFLQHLIKPVDAMTLQTAIENATRNFIADAVAYRSFNPST